MYGTYYSTYSTNSGLHITIPSDASNFLPHTYYVSMVISELCTLDLTDYRVNLSDISDRIDHLIGYIHQDPDMISTVRHYFANENNLLKVLYTMEDSGLLKIHGQYVDLSGMQLDYIRDYLLDYH